MQYSVTAASTLYHCDKQLNERQIEVESGAQLLKQPCHLAQRSLTFAQHKWQ